MCRSTLGALREGAAPAYLPGLSALLAAEWTSTNPFGARMAFRAVPPSASAPASPHTPQAPAADLCDPFDTIPSFLGESLLRNIRAGLRRNADGRGLKRDPTPDPSVPGVPGDPGAVRGRDAERAIGAVLGMDGIRVRMEVEGATAGWAGLAAARQDLPWADVNTVAAVCGVDLDGATV